MKTVMLLINGFGIETKKSYEIYNQELMPNLDELTYKYLFSQIDSPAHNYQEGYQNMCLEMDDLYNYNVVNEAYSKNIFFNNTVFSSIKENYNNNTGNLHIFTFVDKSTLIVEQLKNMLRVLNPNQKKNIFLHIILTSNNYQDYPKILAVLSKMNVELIDYARIGLIIGLANISNNVGITEFNFLFKIMISEVAEKWQSFSQKLDVCYGLKQIPNQVKPFVVNDGFSLKKDDLFMIWNYDKVDLTIFHSILKQIKYGEENNNYKVFSLFEIKTSESIPFILNYEIARNSLVNNLNKLNKKALIFCKKEQVNTINYYANGLLNTVSPSITFTLDNYLFKPLELLNLINKSNYDLYILNYSIDDVKDVSELKALLHNIDIMIGNIYRQYKNNYSMVISSLYGTNRVLKNDKGELCDIIFGERLPIIFIDDTITKKDYVIADGSISNLLPVCYMKLGNQYQDSIITKKNALYRMIFK